MQLESGTRSYAATLRGNRPLTQPNNTPIIPPTESQATRTIAVETSTVGTDCLPIQCEVKQSLSECIESEINEILLNPPSDIRIITPTIPKVKIECLAPLTSMVECITNTMEMIRTTQKYTLLSVFVESINILKASLENFQMKVHDPT